MTIRAPRPASAASKRARGLCEVPFCRRQSGAGRHVCNTCRDRAWRARYPEHHLWKNLKASARRRGIAFTITLADWITWCAANDFVARVGRGATSATVDREDDRRGYAIDNIRPLPNAENAARPRERDTSAAYAPEEHPIAC